MSLTDDQKNLMAQRVGAAVEALNEVLKDAHRFGLRTRVISIGDDHQTVSVNLMSPVEHPHDT